MNQLYDANIIWHNINLATFDQKGPYGASKNAVIAIKDNVIIFIGSNDDLDIAKALSKNITVIDAEGRWMTPGLMDCHSHLVYGGNRANEFEMRLTGKSYEEIARQGGGILSTVKATRSASFDSLYQSAKKRAESLMKEGVTTIEIKSGYGLDLDTEVKMLSVAQALEQNLNLTVKKTFLGAHAVAPEFKDDPDEYIRIVCDQMMPEVKNRNLADAVDAFCENIGFSSAQTQRVFQAARNLNLPIKLHAEQLSDQGGSELAARYNALSVDHIEFISEKGIQAIAESGTVAVLLPGAFYFLRETQKPPIELLRKHNVPMAIATDSNPGSSPCTSLLLMLNMACTFFHLTPEESLKGVTLNAAKALGMSETHGTIAVGKVADLVIWDIDTPAELSYSFGCNPCHTIVKSGVIIS